MSPLSKLITLWESSAEPPDVAAFLLEHANASAEQLLEVLSYYQKKKFENSQPVCIEDLLATLQKLAPNIRWNDHEAFRGAEFSRGKAATANEEEISSRFPKSSETQQQPGVKESWSGPDDQDAAQRYSTLIGKLEEQDSELIYISNLAIGVGQKGRYRLDRILGEGSFGRVYLGFDEELHRQVAVKVPSQRRFKKPEDADAYLAEARAVASLSHPNIVAVFDTGRTQDGAVYVISRYVEGSTLEAMLAKSCLDQHESARIIATVSGALHHAHQKRLIHRDVKPANILIESSSGTPFVADFGLAIREEEYLRQNMKAGTPAYMSPEQARGEGYPLDGRSDVFSVGVILYEMLTGQRPFSASSVSETLRKVIHETPRPPRSFLESISPELEQICLKALRKDPSERYATADAMASDLLAWLEQSSKRQPASGSADSKRRSKVIREDAPPGSESNFSSDENGRFREPPRHRLRKRNRIPTTVSLCVSAVILLAMVAALLLFARATSPPSAANSNAISLEKTPISSAAPAESSLSSAPESRSLESFPVQTSAALEKLDAETFAAEDADLFLEFVETSLSTSLPNYEQVWFEAELLAGAVYQVTTQDSRPFPPMIALLANDKAYFVFPERPSEKSTQIADNTPGREVFHIEVPAAEHDQPMTTRNVLCLLKFYFDARTNAPSSLPRRISIRRLDPVSENQP